MILQVHADGSCHPNPGPGGWGFAVYQDGCEIHSARGQCATTTTNNRMEMVAILQALRWLGDRPARVFSDSQYCTNGLNVWSAGWARRGWTRKVKGKGHQAVVNQDLWMELLAARRPGHSFHWERGHADSIGNIRADALAEAARKGVPA